MMDHDHARKLVQAVLDGHTQSYAELLKGFEKPVYNLAFRMTGSATEAADLTQETFLKAWLKLDKYDLRRPFFTWLYTLSLNLIRNHLKHNTHQPVSFSDSEWHLSNTPSDTAQPLEHLLDQEDHRLWQTRLQQLPLEQREALLLRFYQDISFADIADILGISLSAAKMRVRRGLENLGRLARKQRRKRSPASCQK